MTKKTRVIDPGYTIKPTSLLYFFSSTFTTPNHHFHSNADESTFKKWLDRWI